MRGGKVIESAKKRVIHRQGGSSGRLKSR
jgi:hypothetical protein